MCLCRDNSVICIIYNEGEEVYPCRDNSVICIVNCKSRNYRDTDTPPRPRSFNAFQGIITGQIHLRALVGLLCVCDNQHHHPDHIYLFSIQLKEYKVIGRALPTPKNRVPPLYQMRIFANDMSTAKSRFWYFCSLLRKMKKTQGEIVCCEQAS